MIKGVKLQLILDNPRLLQTPEKMGIHRLQAVTGRLTQVIFKRQRSLRLVVHQALITPVVIDPLVAFHPLGQPLTLGRI